MNFLLRKDEQWGKSVMIIVAVLFAIGIVIYYNMQPQDIEQINNFMKNTFIGTKASGDVAEKLYGNGKYYIFISAVAIIIPIISLPLIVIVMFVKKDFWSDFIPSPYTIYFYLVAIVFAIAFLHQIYFEKPGSLILHRSQYGKIGSTLYMFAADYMLLGSIIGFIDTLRYEILSKLSKLPARPVKVSKPNGHHDNCRCSECELLFKENPNNQTD